MRGTKVPEPDQSPPARNRQLPVRPPEAYHQALAELAARTGRTVTREVLMALDAHLLASGMDPPGQVPQMGRPRKSPPAGTEKPTTAKKPGKRKPKAG